MKHVALKKRVEVFRSGRSGAWGSVCVCVCVLIFRPAEHVLKARVLETLVEYRTLGGKPLDIYLG
jgi:hypothetical protein